MNVNHPLMTRAQSYLDHWSTFAEKEWNALADSGLSHRLPIVVGPIFLCGLAAGAVMMFWHFPLLRSVILIAFMFLKHRIFPVRLEWFGFLMISFAGAVAESQIIIGSRAWFYSETQIGMVPLWLAPLWGLVGMCLITTYQALVQSD